ncbi:MAG: hypothetical protein C0625_06790 [Arcobacter sp.]|nr:MAG: hypothetical protein C0625_06790 [Arcobacter sp.]
MLSKTEEKSIEKRFLDNLINQDEKVENSAIKVYQRLVLSRFLDVLENSFPLLKKQISENSFEKSVIKFMKDTPSTPFVWQIPNDYRKFVKRNKIFKNKKYLYELLYYDWIEIEIYMKEYKFKKQKKFSYKEIYTLSKSARIKNFKYDIINSDYKNKRENFLVIYYDFITDEVVFREINQLIYVLLGNLNKKESLGEVLKNLCHENEINFKEAKALLREPLEELFSNKVFI